MEQPASSGLQVSLMINQNKLDTIQMKPYTDDLIPTATLLITNNSQQRISCRAIIDTGSTANFITESLSKLLRLVRTPCSIPIGAVNGLQTMIKASVTTTIKSKYNGFQRKLDFLVIPTISTITPLQQIDRQSLKIPPNLQLADPEFHQPASVDLLLGTGVSLSILSVGQIKLDHLYEKDLILQKTMLGWIIAGAVLVAQPRVQCHLSNLQTDLPKFWEMEELPPIKYYSPTELECEEQYKKNVSRSADGRYVVALPFNEKLKNLGISRPRALKRFLGLERRLKGDSELREQYKQVINEYLTLGHMKKIDDSEEGFYLPHHAVIKASSLTTKLRVVFDGSATSSTGISLNDALLTGPTIQSDLFSILLTYRLHNFVITGDIEKMYRQISVRKEDRKFQRILWRDDDGNISTYELQTVTFGLASAPFLAVRTIFQLINDEGTTFPAASSTLATDLYMDDYISGTTTINETIDLRDEVIHLLQRGGFNMRRFASNCSEILQGLPSVNINLKLQFEEDTMLKTLGVYWDSQRDTITYSVKPIDFKKTVSERIILSEIAKIFDPLGLVNPVIVYAKLLTQELWRLELDWDESLHTSTRRDGMNLQNN